MTPPREPVDIFDMESHMTPPPSQPDPALLLAVARAALIAAVREAEAAYFDHHQCPIIGGDHNRSPAWRVEEATLNEKVYTARAALAAHTKETQ